METTDSAPGLASVCDALVRAVDASEGCDQVIVVMRCVKGSTVTYEFLTNDLPFASALMLLEVMKGILMKQILGADDL